MKKYFVKVSNGKQSYVEDVTEDVLDSFDSNYRSFEEWTREFNLASPPQGHFAYGWLECHAQSDDLAQWEIESQCDIEFYHDELVRVYPVKDDSGHWYILPFELKEEFFLDERLGLEAFEPFLDFDAKWGRYRTGGDLNNVKLYARI